ncbi:hypothetical protein HRbin12_00529 [bacterium HR12]|nr:hypothetical protein HRbin12_00529 [bacterium HR12]
MTPAGRYPLGALSDTRTHPPVRAARAERTRRRKPLGLVVIPIVLALAGVGLVLLLARGDGGGIPIIGGGRSEEVPPFDFVVRKARAVPTAEGADAKALAKEAEAVADELTPILDELFTTAFLDPAAWRDGDYEAVWARFSDDARAAAEESVETLTLGRAAGETFDAVTPKRGTLGFEVLFDPDGDPISAVASFSFSATGVRTDGTATRILSSGQLFFGNPGHWRITAFEVERADREARVPASPTPSAT